MTEASRPRAILLFGLPESGVDQVGRAIHGAGVALAADAATGESGYAASAALDAAAREIAGAVGWPVDAGPVTIANSSAAASRRRLDRALENFLPQARRAIGAALPASPAEPVLVVAGAMALLPRFWLRAFARAGLETLPVLVHRNPLAVAQLARRAGGPPPRQTVFGWHHHALEVLSAAPDRVKLVATPVGDLAVLGLAARAAVPAHPKDGADLTHVPMMSDQTRDLHRLLGGWNTLAPEARTAAVADLRSRFDEAVTLTGVARVVTPTEQPTPRPHAPAAAPAPTPAAQPLLLHFHIFKNAGTSVDKMLRRNFDAGWAEAEFTGGTLAERHARFRDHLAEHPELSAFSSHTAQLPVPEVPGRAVFPIVFVRHPLLRIRSAYQFERQQEAETRGAILAKSTDLAGYVTELLRDPKMRHARNFQVFRFAAGTPGPAAQDLRRALETAARLPFVGLVEAYDRSVRRLAELVRPLFPEFEAISLHENATSAADERSTDAKLAALRDELGAELYDRLAGENASDLRLYEQVLATYAEP